MIVFEYSCKNKHEPIPDIIVTPIEPIPIDSSKLKPKIEFTYDFLDSGGVKFINKSRGIQSFRWYTSWYRTKAENPVFYFNKNDKYNFLIRYINEKGQEGDTTFYININNASISIKEDSSTLTGIVYGKNININSVRWNDFYGVGWASLPLGTPSSRINVNGYTILIADFMTEQGKDYNSMVNNLKIGQQPLAQLKSYPTTDYSLNKHGWYILFGGQYGFYATGNSPNDSLEILEVKEVYERILFPEMENKAIWVTWHIKADTGERGKIDCVLKMKYIIYKQYFDF